jgi:tetratricopeptide (TPR) repeat protein
MADQARIRVRVRAALVLAVLLALSLLTRRQLRTWESSLALWSHSVLITPQNYVAENVIGSTLLNQDYEKRGESCSDEAYLHFQKSVAINSHYSLGHLNVGFCRQARGDLPGAIADYTVALENTQNKYLRSRALLNLGAASDSAGDFRSSRRYYEQALALYPNDRELRVAESQMEADEEISSQIDDVKASLAIHPEAAGYVRAGQLQLKLGRTRQARESFERALSLDPSSAAARNALQAMDHQRQ